MKLLLLVMCMAFTCFAEPPKYDKVKDKLSCNCGWTNNGRIVGGKETKKNEYPWMVYVHEGCGGSVITSWHVLTAGHCTYGKKAEDIFASVGAETIDFSSKWSLKQKNKHILTHQIAKIIQHELYKHEGLFSYDISILVTKTKITFNQYVAPVCLPNKALSYLEVIHVKVTGWGLSGLKKKFTGELREITQELITNLRCMQLTTDQRFKRAIPNDKMCTYTPKTDMCAGDGGSPIVYLDKATNRYTQVGLVSLVEENCAGTEGAINTDVTYFRDWIKRSVAESHPEVSICTRR